MIYRIVITSHYKKDLNSNNCLYITTHYINYDLNLQKNIIDFRKIDFSHTTPNLNQYYVCN